MGIEFTPQQKKIINARECNILVSAAAGSGKTAVLVERIIQKICDKEHPIDVDRILVVTFTNAAAAQMREKIRKAIDGKIRKHPEDEYLQRQSALLHNAQITTIHQFCLFVIRNHFYTIGLDPVFRVADESELKLLRNKVMNQLMEKKFEEENPEFFEAIEYYCLDGKEEKLEQIITELYDFSMSYPEPMKWLETCLLDYEKATTEEFENGAMGAFFKQFINQRLNDFVNEYKKMVKIAELPDGPYMYGELLEKEMEAFDKVLGYEDLEQLYTKIRAIPFGKLPSKKDDSVDSLKRELVKEMRDSIKKGLSGVVEQFFCIPFSLEWERQNICGEKLTTLIELIKEYKELFDQSKREKKIIDFQDMEQFALQILMEHEQVAKEYQDYFEEIYIDEYQDSNLVQEYLLKAVCSEKSGKYNRFMVGDVKQSIYKFRLAKPAIFLEKYDTYEKETGKNCRIDLSQNFRSRNQVLESVNQVFESIMTEAVGGITYDKDAALYLGANYSENADCVSELLCIEKAVNEKIDAKELEALGIANKIKQLVKEFKVVDEETGKFRNTEYKDIVILLRSNSGWDEVFKKVLMQEGIPAFILSKSGYFEVAEIQAILMYLKVLDNPLQEIPLYAALHSVFGGFSEEEIAVIRSTSKNASLYQCLKNQMETNEKCKVFLEKIELYRKESVFLSASQLLQKIMTDFHYIAYVSALPGGQQRRANVLMLLEKVKNIEKTSSHGLYYLSRYMEQLDRYEVDEGEANISDENANTVKIMSIHKSKGLEFPVTFVAGLGKRFNLRDSGKSFLADDELGIGMGYVDVAQRVVSKTLRRNILAIKNQNETIAEELRILYVAMTRAKEKLILTGVLDKLEETMEKVQLKNSMRGKDTLSALDILSAKTYWDFILPSISSFVTSYIKYEDIKIEQVKEEKEEDIALAQLEQTDKFAKETICASLCEQLNFQYPHQNLSGLYTKTSVSELKKNAMKEELEVGEVSLFETDQKGEYIPRFMKKEEKVSGTMRGNAVHKVMELLPFESMELSEEGIQLCINKEVEKGRLSKEYGDIVNVTKINTFLQSDIGQRVKEAAMRGELYKEQPFVYGIRANQVEEQFPEDETVLIQGIIDVFFEEDGELVLLDYKTDRVENAEELKNRYKVQFDYYTQALEKMLDKKMKQRILYSFHLGCAIEV